LKPTFLYEDGYVIYANSEILLNSIEPTELVSKSSSINHQQVALIKTSIPEGSYSVTVEEPLEFAKIGIFCLTSMLRLQ
jgi:hypothetical protein